MGGAVGAVERLDRIVHVSGPDGPSLPIENGQPVDSFESEGTIVVFSGEDWLPEELSTEDVSPDKFGYVQQFDERLVGETAVTVGAVATPKSQAAGQTLNPVARLSAEELVTTDRGQQLLRESGILEAMDFDNPHDIAFLGVTAAGTNEVELTWGTAPLESFVGIVRDGDTLRLALFHVSRTEADDDVVFLAGGQHRKLLSAPGGGPMGSDHIDAIAADLEGADYSPLLLEGEDPLVTSGAVDASAAEMAAVAPAFERGIEPEG